MAEDRDEPSDVMTAYADFAIGNWALVMAIMAIIITMIAIKTPPQAGVQLKAEYLIEASWDLDRDSDVDLYVRDPLGNIVYFRQKEAGSLHLDHDSRGSLSDDERLPGGTVIKPKAYTEIVTLRGVVAGEYTVNLHLYGAMINGAPNHIPGTPFTVPVHIRIIRINPEVSTKFEATATLERVWSEVTVTRFSLSASGDWLGTDPTPMTMQRGAP